MQNSTYVLESKRWTSEKTTQWIYWAITAPFLITMLMAAIALLSGVEANVEGIIQLGYPVYVCKILGFAKLLGGIAIFQNRFKTIKEWAYAGYTFNLLGASASHAFAGDSFAKIIVPIFILVMVCLSYQQWKNRLKVSENNQGEIQ
jgi:hypothetical protein